MSTTPDLSDTTVNAAPRTEIITGVVERLTYHSEESGYTIARLKREKAIVSLWKAMGKSIALAAPTGRAAQRLSEMTRLEAKTLHRLLEFDPRTMGFKRDGDNPLPCDAIVVDEASMLDLFLAHSLMKAVPKEAQLLLVGDIDQLPSVGPGNVLQDLIASGRVPVVRLTQVFRQAAQSAIVTAAHQINTGQYPTIELISDNPA